MTKGQLSQEQMEQASEIARHQFDHYEDEIDLKELIVALWQGKFTIIVVTVLCAVIAVVYALKVKEVWTSEAVVTEPQLSNFSAYQKMVNDFQPVFDVYQDDGTILVSEKLDDFLLPKNLFQIYMQQYQSRENKKAYITSSSEFQNELKTLKDSVEEGDYRDAETRLYSDWYQKLTANVTNSNDGVNSYTLQGIQDSAEKSFSFFNKYTEYVDEKARSVAVANLASAVSGKQSELTQQKNMLSDQAKNRLKSERELAVYALQIAKAAGVDRPQQNLGNQEIFAINIGSSALEAKVSVLENLSDDQLSIIEPRLQAINSKLSLLNTLRVDSGVSFKTFQYIESPEKPLSRTAPKRSFIAILGVLLGGMLGCFIVLVRFAFRKK